MLSRRQAITTLGATVGTTIGAGALLGGPLAPVALARAATDKRFIVVVLRGGMDGLAAVPPYADRDYPDLRGILAIPGPGEADGALDLDGRFGLHPALAPLHDLYQAKEMAVLHAAATSYRSRSHFDAQDMLENGATSPKGARDGWLNRALALMGSPMGGADRRLGLAVGQGVPLMLRGDTPVGGWAPRRLPHVDDGFLGRLSMLYRGDPILEPALREGMRSQAMTDEVLGGGMRAMKRGGRGRAAAMRASVSAVGKLLADPDGARIAVMEAGGWDTHANQGVQTGQLANRLKGLAEALVEMKTALGPAWKHTVVAVVTEFGRTAAPNGTRGTDHGTGAAAFLLGGAVAGGQVHARWPGLSANRLYQGRDLAPTTDLRSVFKAVLVRHLEIPAADVDRVVFPGSREAKPLGSLIRA